MENQKFFFFGRTVTRPTDNQAIAHCKECSLFSSQGSVVRKEHQTVEMAQRLKALAVLPEHTGSITSTHMTAYNSLSLQVQGIRNPHTGTHAGKTPMYMKRNKF